MPAFRQQAPDTSVPDPSLDDDFHDMDQVTLVQVFRRPCDQPMSSEATLGIRGKAPKKKTWRPQGQLRRGAPLV